MIGNTISHDRIIDNMGRGGMGQFFLSLAHATSDQNCGAPKSMSWRRTKERV